MSLTNEDMSDREVLLAITSMRGSATSVEIANALGKSTREVGCRLGYMKQRLLVVRSQESSIGSAHRYVWDVTPFGETVLAGRVRQTVLQAIQDADPGAAVVMMRELARSNYVDASYDVAKIVQREWRHNVAQRHG